MSESGMPPPETVSVLLILATVFHGFAIVLTSFRLWFRYHTRRLWWDDFLAALALLCDAVCMVGMWMINAPLDNPYTNIEALPTPAVSRKVHILSTWMTILSYTCLIWLARISIVFSLFRVVPPTRGVTMAAFGASGVFACMWTYLLACKSAVCAMNNSWYNALSIRCPIPKWVALSEVCTDALSDVILVALPLRLLWRVKLPSNQKIMVLSVFSTSILVSVVSAIHTAYLIMRASFYAGLSAEIEGAISLIVCNLLVIVTFIYRVFRNGRDLIEGLPGENARSSNRLTTVDLNYSGGSRITSTTGTALTGTNASSFMIASRSDKDTTFGSVTMGGSTPAVTVSTHRAPPPITVTQSQ